jgi:hypothetical protein
VEEAMKHIHIILIILAMLVGCAAIPDCPTCPPENVIVATPGGPMEIEKGQLVPENYWTLPEWEEFVKEMMGIKEGV